MRSTIPGAGRLTDGPSLTSLGITKRRLRHALLASPDTPGHQPVPPADQPPAGRVDGARPAAERPAADRAAPARGRPAATGRPSSAQRGESLPAAVRFDFGWVDPVHAPSMHTMVVRPMRAADVDTLTAAFDQPAGPASGSQPWWGSGSRWAESRAAGSSAAGLGSPGPQTAPETAAPETAARETAARGSVGGDGSAWLFRRYLTEQSAGERLVLVAESDTIVCGYLCVRWRSDYPPFRAADIPEIVDLRVLRPHRRRGVATVLLEVAEGAVATRSTVVGIGFGLHGDFGPAQRLCVKRGFVPDGRGLSYAGRPVAPGATVRVDDSASLMLTKRVR